MNRNWTLIVPLLVITGVIFYSERLGENLTTFLVGVSVVLIIAILFFRRKVKIMGRRDTLPDTKYTYNQNK